MLVVKVSVTFSRSRLILIGSPEFLEHPSFGKIVMDEEGRHFLRVLLDMFRALWFLGRQFSLAMVWTSTVDRELNLLPKKNIQAL
jgi:hypothetical protein